MAEFWSCENCTNIWMVWMVKPSQIPDGTLQKCIKIRKVQNQSNRLCEMIIFSQQLANYESLHCLRKWFGSKYLKQSSWKPDRAIIQCYQIYFSTAALLIQGPLLCPVSIYCLGKMTKDAKVLLKISMGPKYSTQKSPPSLPECKQAAKQKQGAGR